MFFRRKRDSEPMMPFRLGESVRLSMYVVACHPEMPDHIRKWMKEWLTGYNYSLHEYLTYTYGHGVMPLADAITQGLLETQPEGIKWIEDQDSFERWEGELRGRPDEGPAGTTTAR